MTRRISARLREQAAVLCCQTGTCGYWAPIHDDAPDDATRRLAMDAFYSVSDRLDFGSDDGWATRWAEAEALLRTGWVP